MDVLEADSVTSLAFVEHSGLDEQYVSNDDLVTDTCKSYHNQLLDV
jgi:hypothetical protein